MKSPFSLIKRFALFIFFFLLSFSFIYPQELQTPLEKSDYKQLSSYNDIISFCNSAAALNKNIKVEFFGETSEGNKIPALKISNGKFGKDKNKIKVLIFAQQHGNEPSGKEGTLLLMKDIAEGKLNKLFSKIELILIPQMNPDGGEKNKRFNGRGLDLNRNHLILTAPETQALHNVFNQYLPEATLDVHEYYPYGKEWIKFGARKNNDEQIGSVTNSNVSIKIKKLQREIFLPYIKEYLSKNGFTCFEYIPGGVPEKEYIRLSTFDINDGRQSFGSMNTFSFIFEGMNGRDSIDNIKHRALGQYTAMKAYLEFVAKNKNLIKNLVVSEREKLLLSKAGEPVAIQMNHFKNGSKLTVTMLSTYSNTDTLVTVENYRPVVKPTLEVKKPEGYLIPKSSDELVGWVKRQGFTFSSFELEKKMKVEQYLISKIDSIDFEGDPVINPTVDKKEITLNNPSDYYFIPTKQLAGNIIVQALEPQSMIGLATYKIFEHLVRENELYPILRVVK